LRPEVVRGEPDDLRVDRDLDDGVAGEVVLPAGAGLGRGLWPGAWVELVQPLPLGQGPGADTQGTVDGGRGVTDGGLDLPPSVVLQLGKVAPLRAEDAGELADVELGGVSAGRWADSTAGGGGRPSGAAVGNRRPAR